MEIQTVKIILVGDQKFKLIENGSDFEIRDKCVIWFHVAKGTSFILPFERSNKEIAFVVNDFTRSVLGKILFNGVKDIPQIILPAGPTGAKYSGRTGIIKFFQVDQIIPNPCGMLFYICPETIVIDKRGQQVVYDSNEQMKIISPEQINIPVVKIEKPPTCSFAEFAKMHPDNSTEKVHDTETGKTPIPEKPVESVSLYPTPEKPIENIPLYPTLILEKPVESVTPYQSLIEESKYILLGHTDWVQRVCFSHNGTMIASGSHDGTVKIWNVLTKELIHTFTGHSSYVLDVCFSPDDTVIASCGIDKTIKIWSVSNKVLLDTIPGNDGIKSICFSPDGKIIMFNNKGSIGRWNVQTGKVMSSLLGHTNNISCISVSPDNTMFALGSDNGIEIHHDEKIHGIGIPKAHSICFSHDSTKIVSGHPDHTVKIIDVKKGEILRTLYGHTASVSSVCFSPDSKQVISGSDDKNIIIWDTETGEPINVLDGHTEYVRSVSCSRDGKRIVSGSADKSIIIWNI